MKEVRTILVFATILTCVSSCFLNQKSTDIDSFYTTRNYGQFPLLPLIKPVKLSQNDQSLEWGIDMLGYSFNHRLNIRKLKEIGIDSVYVYGKTQEKKWNLYKYKEGEYVYAGKHNGISRSKIPSKLEGEIQVFSIDSTKKTFIEPERWFVLNIADSTTQAFFSKVKYQKYLKEKGISGIMYDINTYHKQYRETGILPWFPDSIKVKLKK